MINKSLAMFALAFLALAQSASSQPLPLAGDEVIPFIPPSGRRSALVSEIEKYIANTLPGGALPLVCGADGTSAIQAALTNTLLAVLPACPQTNPVIFSTLKIPTGATLRGVAGRGSSWIKQADNTNATAITNANSAGGATLTLDSNITVEDLSLDGNGANQSSVSGNKCFFFIGVANITMKDVTVNNCRSDAISFNGNASTTANQVFATNINVNTTIGTGNFAFGTGFQIGNRQRNAHVSNLFVTDSNGPGVLIDSSEADWTNLTVKRAGAGSSCLTSSGNTTADNPGGGGASQTAWLPCPPGIWIRNVTNVVASNLVAHQGFYHGILVTGARHVTLTNLVSSWNSQKTLGAWDDLHIDYNVFLVSGYGENHDLVINNVSLGGNEQTGAQSNDPGTPTTRYGLFINDGMAGSIGDATVAAPGTGYTFNDIMTLASGTCSIFPKLQVTSAPAGVISTVIHNYATGAGVCTVLPANPVSVTGGTGSGATFNVTWSTASITGVVIGQTLTAATRLPAFITGWTVQTVGP